MSGIISYEDYRRKARSRLPRILFDYIDGGSYSEVTVARNTSDMEAISLRQQVMRDMSKLQLATELFGQTLSMPVVLGPVGFSGMYARRGEVQAASAAHSAGVPFCLSSLSVCSFAELAAAHPTPIWFQLYVIKDRAFMVDLLERVWESGVRVLVLTVDLPAPGSRYRDVRSGMVAQGPAAQFRQAMDGLAHPSWLWDVYLQGKPHVLGNFAEAVGKAGVLGDYWVWVGRNFDTSVTWKDMEWVRANWPGPIVVKGVLESDDAKAAAESGADGLVVSNHGGRQLDSVRSSIDALDEIAQAVGDRTTLMMDGGVRSGLDVLKALSIGARACMLGRSWAFALAAEGQAGVTRMLSTFEAELRTAMILSGCSDVHAAGRHMVDVRGLERRPAE